MSDLYQEALADAGMLEPSSMFQLFKRVCRPSIHEELTWLREKGHHMLEEKLLVELYKWVDRRIAPCWVCGKVHNGLNINDEQYNYCGCEGK